MLRTEKRCHCIRYQCPTVFYTYKSCLYIMIKQHYHVAKLQFQIESVGRQAALVVGEGVVHGLSVVRCGKDSRFFIIGRQNLFTALYRNVIFSNW